MLHFSGYAPPAVPIPLLRMTALRARPIAMPNLALGGRTRVKGGEAALGEAWLGLHGTERTPSHTWVCRLAHHRVFGTHNRRTPPTARWTRDGTVDQFTLAKRREGDEEPALNSVGSP